MKKYGGRKTRRVHKKSGLIKRIAKKSGNTLRSVSKGLGRVAGRIPMVGSTGKKVINLFGREGRGLISIAGDTLSRGTKIVSSPLKRLLTMETKSRRTRGTKRSRRTKRRTKAKRRSKTKRRTKAKSNLRGGTINERS